ncbi:hypothetical protein DEO72_LG3g1555 [Vigna unguiculata]|uniref:Arabinogalactan peptide n=1 Tax=Vigna unguiculata TaxID=3917 RepID=A0A4D6LFP3_VIGUN|nr:hypothetical protein DEO72_LG3g1555 [Vigna unguiculata]
MDIRKIACAALIVVASVSVVAATVEVPASAPAPSSGTSAVVPLVGSMVGASILSFFAL